MSPLLLIAVLFAMAQPSEAQPPLADPALEAQVQEVAKTLRCVVCKNQSIADSEALLAKNLVGVVRDRIAAGDSPETARAFVVDRYGEFVLLKPRFSLRNLGLWLGPFAVLGLGVLAWMAFVRQKRETAPALPLSDDERAELARRLGRDDA